jgi:periplasmic protein TonB
MQIHDAEVCGEVSMFESVKQNDGPNGMTRFASLLVSLIVHAVIICLLVVVPLIFFNALHAEELVTFLIEPPPPPVPPPPPSPPVRGGGGKTQAKIDIEFRAPYRIPSQVPPPDKGEPMVNPNIYLAAIPGARGPGNLNGTVIGIPGIGINPEPPPPPPLPPPPRAPVRVGDLQQSKLIHKVTPVYPEMARRAHVSGPVILEALIDEEGNVSTVKILSGNVLLVDAAAAAVRQWKYSPTILSGEPIPVIATITVIFRLE